MKKLIINEIKNNFLPFVSILFFSVVIYSILCMTDTYVLKIEDYTYYYAHQTIFGYGIIAIILSLAFVIFNFGYNKTKISCDLYYSLPVSKVQLYVSKSILTVCEVFLTLFMMALFGTFVILGDKVATSYILYDRLFAFFFIIIAISIVATLLYIPLYYYGNNVIDGLFNLVFGCVSIVLLLSAIYFNLNEFWKINVGNLLNDIYYLSPVSLPFAFIGSYRIFIFNEIKEISFTTHQIIYIIALVAISMVAYITSLFFVKQDKAERSQEVDKKWFGYKIFTPFLIVTIILSSTSFTLLYSIFLILGAFVLGVLRRRSFKLGLYDVIMVLLVPSLILITVGVRNIF